MPPAARIGDMHTCPLVTSLIPHVGGPIAAGEPSVIVGFMPAARLGDMATCAGPPDSIAKGSMSVLIGHKPAARIGDLTVHGGVVTVGFPSVLIGELGTGRGGGAGGATAAGGTATTAGETAPAETGNVEAAFLQAARSGTALVERCDSCGKV